MNTNPADTYEGQLAARAAELLPGIGAEERLELLGVMDPDDMRTSLAWLASHAPQMFDFALVRDRAMVGGSRRGSTIAWRLTGAAKCCGSGGAHRLACLAGPGP